MQNQKKTLVMTGIVILLCMIMAVVDGVLKTQYFLKSGIKLVLFLGVPAVCNRVWKDCSIKSLFVPDKKSIRFALWFCIPIYLVILGGYLCLQDVFDFSGITKSLTENIGVRKENFLLVSLYISLINSLLEEVFFRGYAFLLLKKVAGRRFAYLFSSLIFAAYHVAMMIGWFSVWVFALVLAGLFVGGMIFNVLDEKTGTIYPSWFVHMFANFAINTIGFILFGVL